MKHCLFGAAPDTGNLGVSALCFAMLGGLFRADPRADITVFDFRRGVRRTVIRLNGQEIAYTCCGSQATRRIYRRESLWNIRWSARLGGLGNPAVKAMRSASAILDISGGDSFTDLYGEWRFWSVTWPKLIALEMGRPLILLPQTYGPFRDARLRSVAADVVRRARLAWARDARSFEALRDLLSDDFDPARHRSGVDVAFGLETCEPQQMPERLTAWLHERGAPLVGFNVSGLIYNDPAGAAAKYGLKADYRKVVMGFVKRLLSDTDCRIVLVPHVVTPRGHYESDGEACEAVAKGAGAGARDRLVVLPELADPRQVKWVIGQLDWFCGTRMHATIAALSSGVPTAAIAYSPKTLGVFETCGQGECVAAPRCLGTVEMVERLWKLWTERKSVAASLTKHLPDVLERAQWQMDEIVKAVGLSAPLATAAC